MFIYAIIAVDYFRDFGGGYAVNSYLTNQGNGVEGSYNTTVSAMTARGYTIGDEYYGTFTRSLYTLFQVGRTRMHFGLDIYVCVCVAPSSARCVQCSLYMLSLCSLRQDTRTRLLAHLTCTSYTCK